MLDLTLVDDLDVLDEAKSLPVPHKTTQSVVSAKKKYVLHTFNYFVLDIPIIYFTVKVAQT